MLRARRARSARLRQETSFLGQTMDIEAIARTIPIFETYPQWAKYTLASSFVVGAASIVVFALGAAMGYRAADPKVSIIKPAPDTPVAWGFSVEGTVQNIPNGYELWIMTSANEKYWPQERIVRREDNTWVARVRNIGGAP